MDAALVLYIFCFFMQTCRAWILKRYRPTNNMIDKAIFYVVKVRALYSSKKKKPILTTVKRKMEAQQRSSHCYKNDIVTPTWNGYIAILLSRISSFHMKRAKRPAGCDKDKDEEYYSVVKVGLLSREVKDLDGVRTNKEKKKEKGVVFFIFIWPWFCWSHASTLFCCLQMLSCESENLSIKMCGSNLFSTSTCWSSYRLNYNVLNF